MSWLQKIFKPAGLSAVYGGLRNVISSVYRPINYAINKVASTVNSVDTLLNRGKDLPILRDLIGLVQGNPIYQTALNLTKDVKDASNIAGGLGEALDNTITKELNGSIIARPTIPPSMPGSVASSLNSG